MLHVKSTPSHLAPERHHGTNLPTEGMAGAMEQQKQQTFSTKHPSSLSWATKKKLLLSLMLVG